MMAMGPRRSSCTIRPGWASRLAAKVWNIETIYVVLAYWLIGIGAVLTPFALRRRALNWYWGASLVVGALMIGWLGLVSFFGHISLAG